jgi:hypothetical protein
MSTDPDEPGDAASGESGIRDDRLRLIFTCCHPALEARVALTLRTLAGLTTSEIARAVDAGGTAGVVHKHEREQPQRLGLVGHEPGEGAGQADGLGAQTLPYQVGARAGRVALVEEQVEDGNHRVSVARYHGAE